MLDISIVGISKSMTFLSVVFLVYLGFIIWEIHAITTCLMGRAWTYLPIYLFKGASRRQTLNLAIVKQELGDLLAVARNGSGGSEAGLNLAIEAVWRRVDECSYFYLSGLNAYVYSLILWGFAGTIYGTMAAFQEISRAFGETPDKLFDVVQAGLSGGLTIAMWSSLIAAVLGAVVAVLRRMLLRCVVDFEHVVAKEISARVNRPSDASPLAFTGPARRAG